MTDAVPIPEISDQRSRASCASAAAALQDTALVERVIAGDEFALTALYDRYAGMLYLMLLRILKDNGAAEEVLQDLFLEVWRRADRFDRDRGSPLAWMLVIGRSRALSRLRVGRRREMLETSAEFLIDETQYTGNFESDLGRVELIERLRRAVRSLPPRQKEALELAYFEGMTQTEIADRTGSALGTVKSRVRAAMQRLKALFADESAF